MDEEMNEEGMTGVFGDFYARDFDSPPFWGWLSWSHLPYIALTPSLG